MAAIDFPASPSPGDKHPTSGSISGKVWMWDGTTWKIVSTNGTVNLTVDDVTTWTLGASGSNHYTFTGDGFVSATNDPTLYLIRGQTYQFDNQTGGHPFRIQSTVAQAGGGTAYNSGVTNQDASGGNALTFVVPMDAPDTLYYQCTAHPAMTGTIYVITQGSGSSYNVVDDQADGLAPQLPVAHGGKFLKADGTWEVPAYIANTDTTYNVVDSTADGLAPQLPVAHGDKFLKADGTWEVPAYVTYSTFTTTAAGLAPLTPGGTDKFLRADGQWQIPSGSGGGSGYGIAQILFENGPTNQISAVSGGGSGAAWIDVIDKSITLTDTNQVKIEVNGEPRLDGFRTMRYEIRLIRTTGGTATTLYEGHQGLSDSSDNYSTMNGVLWLESPGVGTHNYKYQFRQVISWNSSVAYVAADSMTITLTEIAPGSSGGTSDGNDYVTSAQLGTGANAKVLTLGFVNASLNQTVDLASINTDTNTTYSLVDTVNHGLAPVLPATHGGKFLKADGTWEVPPDTDTNTTYSTVSISAAGLAPQLPASGGSTKYLRGDGTWDTPPDTDTTYQNFNTSNAGLTPISPGGTTKYLRADGSWEVPPDTDTDTNTTYGVVSTVNNGLCPFLPAANDKFLRSDGTWQQVSGGGSSDGNDYVTGASLGTGADAKKLTLSFGDTSLNQTVDLASIDTDTDTTYNVVSAGAAGLAPQLPASGGSTQYLRGDGTWDTPPDTDTNTTYGQFSTSQAGLVPQSPGGTTKYLRADGSWQTVTSGGSDGNDYVTNLSLSGTTLKAEFATSSLDQEVDLASINTDTTYSNFNSSAAGLVPSSGGGTTKYLRADGTWQTPPDTDTNTDTNYYANSFAFNSSNNVLTIEYAGNTSLNTTVTINPSSSGSGDIPSGTAMLFAQGSAPTGWTKSTSHNNKALRVVSGSGGGSGGSVGFTSAFQNHTVSISGSDTVNVGGSVSISGNCTGTQVMYVTTTQAWLTTDQMPSHNHQYHNPIGTSGGQHGFVDSTNSGSSGQPTTNSTGGSNYHTHAVIMYYINGSNFSFSGTDGWSDSDTVSISGSDDVNCAVQYVDVIICTKD